MRGESGVGVILEFAGLEGEDGSLDIILGGGRATLSELG